MQFADKDLTTAGYEAKGTLGDIRLDGIHSIFERIGGQLAALDEITGNLDALANRIGGAEPSATREQPKEPPIPEVALFKARAVEVELGRILDRQRGIMNRMDKALS